MKTVTKKRSRSFKAKTPEEFDRSADKRRSSKGCTKGVQNAVDYTCACEMFYTMLANGTIKPREE